MGNDPNYTFVLTLERLTLWGCEGLNRQVTGAFLWSASMNVTKWCENGSQVATTEQHWWICPRLMRQLVGRRGIVFLSLGMHWVICGYRGDAIPFHPSSNGRLTAADVKNAPVPFLSTLLAFSRHGPPLLQMCPHSLIRCQRENNSVIKANNT